MASHKYNLKSITTAQQTYQFFRLPGELRNEVYRRLMPEMTHYDQLYLNPRATWWNTSFCDEGFDLLERNARIAYSLGSQATGMRELGWIYYVLAHYLRHMGFTIHCDKLPMAEELLWAVAHRGTNIETLDLHIKPVYTNVYNSNLLRRALRTPSSELCWTKPLPDEILVEMSRRGLGRWRKEQGIFCEALVRILERKMKGLDHVRVYVMEQRGSAWVRALADELNVEVQCGYTDRYPVERQQCWLWRGNDIFAQPEPYSCRGCI
ncbi:hypothetical protein B0H67DRAFT_556500 [Lasiosphaeris hirsuta]|uniref:Uncharacterized protein n=1 Tax=Lasiosphaeris hirsuta TaxID=260670 RepID=A0AA40DLT7_9PEZI|nr:hypothetical protein B0H67DRAFT_556500 [Lasiosphaeris hirsuta]